MNKNERESQENILRISHIVSKAFSLGKELMRPMRRCILI